MALVLFSCMVWALQPQLGPLETQKLRCAPCVHAWWP